MIYITLFLIFNNSFSYLNFIALIGTADDLELEEFIQKAVSLHEDDH